MQPKSHASATLTLTVPSRGCSMHPGWPGCWTLNRRRPLVMSARLRGPSPTLGGCKIHPQLDTGVACTCNYRGFARRFTTAHWGNSAVRSFRIELGRGFPHRHSPCDVDCGSCCLHLQPARIRVYVPSCTALSCAQSRWHSHVGIGPSAAVPYRHPPLACLVIHRRRLRSAGSGWCNAHGPSLLCGFSAWSVTLRMRNQVRFQLRYHERTIPLACPCLCLALQRAGSHCARSLVLAFQPRFCTA